MLRWLKDHVVPHAGNDYRPHLLQKVAMVAMLGLVMVSFALANLHALLWLNIDWLISAVLPAVVVEETNDERADGAIGPLVRNTTLDRAAQLKAEHMAEMGYFAHYAPDGTSPWHWFRSVNYPFVHAGENLAVHFNDSQEVVDAWMDSPTHRANIMNGNYTEIGIGVAEGRFEGHATVFVVQLFGTPAATAAAPVATAPAQPVAVATAPAEPEPTPAATPPPVVAAAERNTDRAAESSAVLGSEETTEAVVDTPDPLPSNLVRSTETVPRPTTTPTTERTAARPATATTPIATAQPTPEQEQFIATTTNAVPARTQAVSGTDAPVMGWLGSFVTSPQSWLQALYTTLGLFVVGVLVLSGTLEWRRQQPVQVAYSVGLLAVMGGLYYLQTLVTTGATIALAG